MRDNQFLDGVMFDARRNYTPSQRSWHIPEDREPSRFGLAVAIVAALIVGLSLIGSVA